MRYTHKHTHYIIKMRRGEKEEDNERIPQQSARSLGESKTNPICKLN